jgi:hypothetical protein
LARVLPNDAEYLAESSDHREVLRRLIEVAGDLRRLVTPTEIVAQRSIELGGQVYPAGVRPPHLVNVLDDLVGLKLAERIVPAAGESSYRPTELARERLGACVD